MSNIHEIRIDSHKLEKYPEALYQPEGVLQPIYGFEGFDENALTRYETDGVIAIEQAFNAAEVESMINGLSNLVMGCYPEFEHLEYESEAKDKIDGLSAVDRQDYVRKLMYFCSTEKKLAEIAYSDQVVGLARKILGAEPDMFQDMALFKPPNIGREKPWHQDHAYFNLPEGTPVVGFWIALDDATLENGCMHFITGAHHDGPVAHFNRRDWQICDTDVIGRRCMAGPVKSGGCLVFNGLVPHGTPQNMSPKRRRALQFHYCPAGISRISTEERIKLFGEEGRDVSC